MIKKWIPDAVYPCEACPCESREQSREQGVVAGMTNLLLTNFFIGGILLYLMSIFI